MQLIILEIIHYLKCIYLLKIHSKMMLPATLNTQDDWQNNKRRSIVLNVIYIYYRKAKQIYNVTSREK